MEFEKAPRKLWEHPHPELTAMWRFMQESNRRYGLTLKVGSTGNARRVEMTWLLTEGTELPRPPQVVVRPP